MFEFIVRDQPKGKARARTVRNSYTGKVHSYTPKKTVAHEKFIKSSYILAGGKHFGEKPLEIAIKAYCEIPKSYTKKQRLAIEQGELKPTKKPDCDNIIKAVCDALNGVAYKDDKQVICVSCNKYYSDTGYLHITIKEL